MKRMLISKGVLAFMLVLALIFVGCDEDEPDVWSSVTSLSQLNGRWIGSYSETMSVAELSNQGFGSLNANVTVTVSEDMTINASAQTFSNTGSQTNRFDGSDGQTAYNLFKLQHVYDPDITTNDSNRSVTMTMTVSNQAIPGTFLTGFEINQNGSKIRRQVRSEAFMVYNKG